jgi:hypothetical protein
MKHSPEDWTWYGPTRGEGVTFTNETHFEDGEGNTIGCVSGDDKQHAVDNVKRVVDCVNACKGIDNPVYVVPQLIRELKRMIASSCRCRGKGYWFTDCPLCDDSTYDHVCEERKMECQFVECRLARELIAKVDPR